MRFATMSSPDTRMRRRMPGLHDGNLVRAERVGGSWSAQVKMRDVGHLLDIATNYYEHSPDGSWIHVGSYRRLIDCQEAAARLIAGTHVLYGAHGNECGAVPARIIPFRDAADEIRRRTALDLSDEEVLEGGTAA